MTVLAWCGTNRSYLDFLFFCACAGHFFHGDAKKTIKHFHVQGKQTLTLQGKVGLANTDQYPKCDLINLDDK